MGDPINEEDEFSEDTHSEDGKNYIFILNFCLCLDDYKHEKD